MRQRDDGLYWIIAPEFGGHVIQRIDAVARGRRAIMERILCHPHHIAARPESQQHRRRLSAWRARAAVVGLKDQIRQLLPHLLAGQPRAPVLKRGAGGFLASDGHRRKDDTAAETVQLGLRARGAAGRSVRPTASPYPEQTSQKDGHGTWRGMHYGAFRCVFVPSLDGLPIGPNHVALWEIG